VLKVQVVRPDGYGYYVGGRSVHDGRELAGSELEGPGVWTGAAAGSLGLQGTVDPEPFSSVMHGLDPGTGQALRSPRGPASVGGYDLTFCAPKSVSLLAALAPRELAVEAGLGHDAAVADASAYLARHGLGVRRAHGRTRSYLASTGMVAGSFRHLTSRALDPHLHTHVVAANIAHGVDGRWSAVDSRRVFAHVRAAGSVYQASLRLELGERLGVGWDVRPSGLGDVAGVDPALRRLFSQRTASIEELVARRFGGDGRRHRGAFYATRPEKDVSASIGSLTDAWRRRAEDFGFDLGELGRVVGRGRSAARDLGTGGRSAIARFDPERLARRLREADGPDRTLSRGDLVVHVAAASPEGATARQVESVVDAIVDASGSPTSGVHGSEQRWRVGAVARTLGEGRDLTGAASSRCILPDQGPGPSPGWHGRAVVGREHAGDGSRGAEPRFARERRLSDLRDRTDLRDRSAIVRDRRNDARERTDVRERGRSSRDGLDLGR
jgi:conjugative relaxase-like TrwC/TraI family protein